MHSKVRFNVKKISLFCQVPTDRIIINKNVKTIYEVPLQFQNQKVVEKIQSILSLVSPRTMEEENIYIFSNIVKMVHMCHSNDPPCVRIMVTGKYTGQADTYLSIKRALGHAGLVNNCRIDIDWISSEIFGNKTLSVSEFEKMINIYDGVLIPGGFGHRGVEGMIKITKYCRQAISRIRKNNEIF